MADNPFAAPLTSETMAHSQSRNTLTLKYIHPLQAGKVLAILYFGIGLIIVPIFVLAAFAAPNAEAAGASLGTAIGMIFMYTILGFIGGMIAAAIYNLAAHMIGGLRFDFE